MTLRPPAEVPPRPLDPVPGPAPAGPDLRSRTVLLGLVGSVVVSIASFGAGGVLRHDPLLDGTVFGVIRYGHGQQLATIAVFLGVGLLLWAWVRLGRDAFDGTASPRQVLLAAAAWTAPMLICPPLFTRDVYIYLAQGALAQEGFDPYEVGPAELGDGELPDNVPDVWQHTPAPYGPAFMMLARGIHAITGDNAIAGVLVMRFVLLSGLALLVYAVPRLADHLGGSRAVALWVVVANPVTVVHLVGGPHNDLLMIGLLALGALLLLQGRPVPGIVLVTLAGAIKATGLLTLPFLVLIWAARMPGERWWPKLLRAGGAATAVFVAVFGALTLAAGDGLGWIDGLSSPSKIVNWLSWPTGLAELTHNITFEVFDRRTLIDAFRPVGLVVLAAIGLYQWWRSRGGGPDAVKRAGVVLLFAAVLAPVTLPWYPSWGAVLVAGMVWSRRGLAVVAAVTAGLLAASYPTGDTTLYDGLCLAMMAGAMALAAWSVMRPDPLGLRTR